MSSDCPTHRACIRNKCVDPCPGVCGNNAQCSALNHVPTCNCIPGYTGDPFRSCIFDEPPATPPTVVNPCRPSPCGPNSQCREINEIAVCSCVPDFTGSPPNCRPECTVNAECPSDKACHKFKCTDPCRGTCGVNARCEVINHNPICSCPSGMTGDPFSRCAPLPPPPPIERPRDPINPCVPSPCGLYSECRAIGESPSCSCLPNYIGLPPNCRPECVVNTDCPSNQACIAEKCKDPCVGSCGLNTECRVQNHIPICSCRAGFTGDPFYTCSEIRIERPPPLADDPCNPSPCGANANCNGGLCTCIANYFGDPYQGCRPECTLSTDCSPDKACSNLRCINPCIGTCGSNAKCDVINHIPSCSCPVGYIGDPFVTCRPAPVEPPRDPCNPSPCGANTQCRVSNGAASCSCLPGMIGAPPSCRPECVISGECDLQRACINNKCIDPCPGTCGQNAKCQVINHNPICSCQAGQTGNPFVRCELVRDEPIVPENPCVPSPCGANSQCRVVGESPACSCLAEYIGTPPNCRPECSINPECPSNLACINQKCRDPCPGSCGLNARCNVINHSPVCSCDTGFIGDPFTSCQPIPGKSSFSLYHLPFDTS